MRADAGGELSARPSPAERHHAVGRHLGELCFDRLKRVRPEGGEDEEAGSGAADRVAALFADGFGTTSAVSRIVYGLVGVGAVYHAVALIARSGAMASERVGTHA